MSWRGKAVPDAFHRTERRPRACINTHLVPQRFLCLSRACLAKMIVFGIQWHRKKGVFLAPLAHSMYCVQLACKQNASLF
jgi:hypothetical protein